MLIWISPSLKNKGKKKVVALCNKKGPDLESDLGLWLGFATFSFYKSGEIIQSHWKMHIHKIGGAVTSLRRAFS